MNQYTKSLGLARHQRPSLHERSTRLRIDRFVRRNCRRIFSWLGMALVTAFFMAILMWAAAGYFLNINLLTELLGGS